MVPFVIAAVVELGIPQLALGALGVFNLTKAAKAKKRKPRVLPMEDGRYFAGKILTAREIRRESQYAYHKAFLLKHADDLELTATQRRRLGFT